jgi:hypothetical protein
MAGPRMPRRAVLAGALVQGLGAVSGVVAPVAHASSRDGIRWPAGQELPTFARPRRLHALFMASDTPADLQILITTLQGLVNRTRPQIYVVRGEPSEGARTWLRDSTVPYKEYTDPWKLLRVFAGRASGVVVYDPQVVETINVATTLAGLRDGVVASPELATTLAKPPYRMRVLEDFRGRFSSNLEATRWQLTHLFPMTNHRVVLGVNPGTPPPLPPDNWKSFVEIVREERPIRDASNRQIYELDLSAFAGSGKLFLRMQDSQPSDGWGGAVHHVVLTVDGETVADFRAGEEAERKALFDHGGAGFKPQRPNEDSHRFADGSSYFIYEFDVPTSAREIVASIDMFNQFLVSASQTPPAVSSDDRVPASLPLRDYAVALKAMPFWMQSTESPEEADLMRQIFAAHERGTPYLGWFPDEFAGVRLASSEGVYVLAADFLENATVHGGLRARIEPQRPASPPPLANKIYLTFTFAEGDNVQYDQHRLRQIWDDPNRGVVPLNWSVSPLLVDLAPLIIGHYLRTATPNDLLVAGPSGAGYFYPSSWPQDHLPTFLAQNKPYLDKLGIRVVYALDDIPALEEASARAYVEQLKIDGIVYNMWAQRSQTTILAGTLPVSTQIAHTDRTEILARIRANAEESFDGTAPVFIAVGVPSWNLGPTDVVWIMEQLGEEFVAVRGDQYFAPVREAHGISA